MAELVVEMRRTSKLRPHPQNSRVHSKAQVAQIWASIQKFGFTNPLLIDEADTVLAGHGRLAGAKLGKMAEIPVIVLRGLTDEQKRAYIITDNRLAEGSEWDKDKLMAEVKYLQEQDFSLDYLDLGSMDEDLAALVGDEHDSETPEDKRDREAGKKKRKSSADKADEATQEGGDPSKDKDSINFPLYVVLTPPDYKRWKALKGQLSDKQVVMALLNHADVVTQLIAPA